MSNSGSGDGPMGGRRPAPKRPIGGQRPAAPQRPGAPPPADDDDDDAEERTQALDLSSFAARPGASPPRPSAPAHEPEDDGESTVAMQLPAELLDEIARGGGNKTIMGHPGASGRTTSAVRGAAPAPRRNETLAMSQRPGAPAGGEDEGEATMALNVDSLLAQIDEKSTQRPAAAPARSAPARPAPARPAPVDEDENESTMAVDMSDVVSQIAARNASRGAAPAPARPAPAPAPAPDYGDDDDEGGATVAMNIDDMRAEMQRQAAAKAAPPRREMAPQAPARMVAAPAGALAGGLAPAPETKGLFGPIAYALAYDGRKQQIDDALAAIAAGTAPPEVGRAAGSYRAEQSALDPAAARQGWITLGSIAGGVTALVVVLGLIL